MFNTSKSSRAGFTTTPHLYFFFTFGLFGALHWISNTIHYGFETYASTHLMGLAGLVLALSPGNRIAFVIFVIATAVDSVLQAPVLSNHTMMKNFLLLAIFAAAAETSIRRENWSFFTSRMAAAGRWLLIILYVYGVFHKLNTDFLDPDVSCAVALWERMLMPQFLVDNNLLKIMGIYATLVIETAILLLLLFRPTRHLGVVMGMLFHILLGLSAFAFYPTFSTLTLALHALFLPTMAHIQMSTHPLTSHILVWLGSSRGHFMIGIFLAFMGLMVAVADLDAIRLGWLLIVIPFFYLISNTGRESIESRKVWSFSLTLRPAWVPILAVLFVFNGATPYLGLKTAQSMNMFANLQLEGGSSNHLIWHRPPGPFGYLNELVEITDPGSDLALRYVMEHDLRLVYYDFLNRMQRANINNQVSYRVNNESFTGVSPTDLAEEIRQHLHPKWVRKWFHFSLVDLSVPKPCAPNR